MHRLVLLALVLPLSCFAQAQETEENCPEGKHHCRATLRHIESGGIGYQDGYTTFEVFLASDPSEWSVTPFLDGRGHVFDSGTWATNVGMGLRAILGTRAYGLNTYYDFRDTHKLSYNQISVGLETLGELLDFRINGYLPVGNKTTAPYNTQFVRFSGHHMIVSRKYQYALKGIDTEVGFHFGKSELFDFYAATGPYYYKGQLGPNIWGGKARIAGMFKEYVAVEVSDSYDNAFHNRFQGQVSLTMPLGPKSRVKKSKKVSSCKMADALTSRMVQPVGRQEIIPIDSTTKQATATDPVTGAPLFFVFVNNLSSSLGTYNSPYPTLAQAQANSGPGNIIYVFPGDGTTRGMNSGISLKANQKFWGSGVSHSIQTGQGSVSIPAQSSSSPTITNTNVDTEGNAVTLATSNAVSGFRIRSPLNDAIYGTNSQSFEVSSCTIESATTYAVEATSLGNASVSITNNQFLNNVNGISLTLNGTSSVTCSDNTFDGQTSVSNVPVEIASTDNILAVYIERNVFSDNTTGSIRFSLTNVVDADIRVLNNEITNNGTGSQSTLGSSCVVISSGTNDHCAIALRDNTFSDNGSNSLYLHTSGSFSALEITASTNTMSNNGGSALVLATPVNVLALHATDNTITECDDNGIAVISSGTTSTGDITINNNTITDIGNSSNGIAINQNFTTLNLTLLDNTINRCEGTGVISYASTGINSFALTASGNTISNCQNLSSNAAAGLDIEQFISFEGSVTNNTLLGNTGTSLVVGSTLTAPTACLFLTGNNSTNYLLTNPGDGVFNLSPCSVVSSNVGTIDTSGTITRVKSCSDETPCPP